MQSLVLHWDGKLLPDLVGRKKVERIAVLVSYNGTSKLLGAPKVLSGTGENIAAAVYNQTIEWNIFDRIAAISFDTTSSNTGDKIGACTLLGQQLDRKLIYLPCRHHMYELVLKQIFLIKHGTSSGPEVLIFNRFAEVWNNLDQTLYKTGFEDDFVRLKISGDECEAIKNFCHQQLQLTQIRADYKELLQLSLTFLGEDCDVFKTCGATSHARFMSKGIYVLKIFLFRDQFILTVRELKALRDIAIFLVRLYLKVWYGCTNAIAAPNQDLNFMKEAAAYASTDQAVADAILNKFKSHL